MATRSRIGIEREGGRVESIYCHYDGYPAGVGETLLNHYQNPEKVEKLIALGAISSLGEEVEPSGPHSFNAPQDGVTVAYHRDRGEKRDANKMAQSVAAYFKDNGGWEDYIYLYTAEGQWLFCEVGETPQVLTADHVAF